jgi:hypothetical protein
VLEFIFARIAAKVDQVERLHRLESRIEVGLAHGGGQQLCIETPADHCGCLQERTVVQREAIHAPGQQALHARRQGGRHRRRIKVHFTPVCA